MEERNGAARTPAEPNRDADGGKVDGMAAVSDAIGSSMSSPKSDPLGFVDIGAAAAVDVGAAAAVSDAFELTMSSQKCDPWWIVLLAGIPGDAVT